MRVECRGRNRDLAGLVQETRVWFHAREFFAFEIEYLDGVGTSSTIARIISIRIVGRGKGDDLHSEDREVLMSTRCPERVIRGLNNPQWFIHPNIP